MHTWIIKLYFPVNNFYRSVKSKQQSDNNCVNAYIQVILLLIIYGETFKLNQCWAYFFFFFFLNFYRSHDMNFEFIIKLSFTKRYIKHEKSLMPNAYAFIVFMHFGYVDLNLILNRKYLEQKKAIFNTPTPNKSYLRM